MMSEPSVSKKLTTLFAIHITYPLKVQRIVEMILQQFKKSVKNIFSFLVLKDLKILQSTFSLYFTKGLKKS